jgi:hypothetical protein
MISAPFRVHSIIQHLPEVFAALRTPATFGHPFRVQLPFPALKKQKTPGEIITPEALVGNRKLLISNASRRCRRRDFRGAWLR